MLAIILALASAIGYGGSDFAAGLASRAASVIQVSLLVTVASAALVFAALRLAGLALAGACVALIAAGGAG